MPAYIVCKITVIDPAAYERYVQLAGPAVRRNGGRFLVRGGSVKVLEGSFDRERIVVAEFADEEAARRSYESPEYQAARAHRLGAAQFDAILLSDD